MGRTVLRDGVDPGGRDLDTKRGSATDRRLHRDRKPQHGGQPPYNPEPETKTVPVSAPRFFESIEVLKNRLKLVARDSDAGVPHG